MQHERLRRATSPEGVYRVGGLVSAPQLLGLPDLEYPQEALQSGIEGMVQLQAVIGRNGVSDQIQVTQSLQKRFDERAIETLKGWRF